MKRIIFSTLLFVCSVFQAQAADEFKISFKWCNGSPLIDLFNVNKDASKIHFQLIDLWSGRTHLEGYVNYKGQKSISCGSIPGFFFGNPPPPNDCHEYKMYAKVYNIKDDIVSKADFSQYCPWHSSKN